MSMSDPVADLLTRIRNGSKAKKPAVDVPASNLKRELIKILREEHFVRDVVELPDNKQGILRVYLRYSRNDKPVIRGIQRISSPGLHKYVNAAQVRLTTHNTRGISVLSTSQGLMTNYEAARRKIGGELMLRCW